MTHTPHLRARPSDRRGNKVVFLAHCLLNENMRYPGGACRAGCVREIVEACLEGDLGIVQMPCPEQRAWGGVLKRRMLWLCGTKSSAWYPLLRACFPLLQLYTRWVYSRLARKIAGQIEDHVRSGLRVAAVVGIDGSPSCGVARTLDMKRGLDGIAALDDASVAHGAMNTLVRQRQEPGAGLFIDLLRKRLGVRRVEVPFLGHDLLGELEGRASDVRLLAPGSGGKQHHSSGRFGAW